MVESVMYILESWPLIVTFFIVAVLYSSVGFGGGSSYLAILALWGMEIGEMKVIALMCNVAVVAGAVLLYQKKGLYKRSNIMYLVALSIPLAFVGGYLRIKEDVFFVILGLTLILAGLITFWRKTEVKEVKQQKAAAQNVGVGGAIGFLSGLVGIGGGIFLSPFLHLTKSDTTIRIAAFSSFFILMNSVAGLVGNFAKNSTSLHFQIILPLLIAVVLGGQLGVRMSLKKLSPLWIRRLTAILVLFVGLRLLWGVFE